MSDMASPSLVTHQPTRAHLIGLFFTLLVSVLLLGVLLQRLLTFLHSRRTSPPLSAAQSRMLTCHGAADIAQARKAEQSLPLPTSSPSAAAFAAASIGQSQQGGKRGQAWLLLFVGSACVLSVAAVGLFTTAVTGGIFNGWPEEAIADCLHLIIHLCIILITLSEAQTAAQIWIVLERSSRVGCVLTAVLGAQLATGLAGGVTALRTRTHIVQPSSFVIDVYLVITAVLALFLAGLLAARLRSAPNGPSAHGFTTLAQRALQSGGLKGVLALTTLGLHMGLSSSVWVGALVVTSIACACCILGNLNARHALRTALQATLTEVSRTEASHGPTWAQVQDLINAANRVSAPQTPVSLCPPKLTLVCSTPEPGLGNLSRAIEEPLPSLLHRRRRTSISLELDEVLAGDGTHGHAARAGLGRAHTTMGSPRFLGSLLRRCSELSPRNAAFPADATTIVASPTTSPSSRFSSYGFSRAASTAGHGLDVEAVSHAAHTHDAEHNMSMSMNVTCDDPALFVTCEQPQFGNLSTPSNVRSPRPTPKAQKRRSLPYGTTGEGYGQSTSAQHSQSQSRPRAASVHRRPSAPLLGSMLMTTVYPSLPSPSTATLGTEETNDTSAQAAAQQSSDVERDGKDERRESLV